MATADRLTGPLVGLCATCHHHRIIASGKGSRFLLCERSRSDSRFPRYPSLPVLACLGFQPQEPARERGNA
jgi:hypothetical protein